MITGKLRKDTWVYTTGNFQVKLERGAKVKCEGRQIVTFDDKDDIVLFKVDGQYLMSAFGDVHKVVFPKGGQVPYPLSLLI